MARSKKWQRKPWASKQKQGQTSGSYTIEELTEQGEYPRKYEPSTRKKRKYAILCGYLGLRYHGLQIQPDPAINTIEKQLERAIFLAGAIQESNFGDFQKVNWQRAARTDKGVHAVGQIVTVTLQLQADEVSQFVDRCNEFLPEDIRVFDCIRVTNGFNPKTLCYRRRYQYLLPTYAVQPKDALESTLKQAYDEYDTANGIVRKEEEPTEATNDEKGGRQKLAPEDLSSVIPGLCSWRIDEETLTRLRAALNKYVGTNNFHNFTSGLRATDKSAMRYIVSFEASDPMIDEKTGQEWVCLTVVGQSFLLHQIRKMVALAVEVARGGVPIEHMDRCLSQSKVLIPIAPGDNLHLDMLFYDPYNAKVQQMHKSAQPSKKRKTDEGVAAISHAADTTDAESKVDDEKQEEGDGDAAEPVLDHQTLDWDADPVVSERILGFKRTCIWRHIFDMEFERRTALFWLDGCRFLAYRFQVVPDDFSTNKEEGGGQPSEDADEVATDNVAESKTDEAGQL